ncbi:MAG: histidinol-phosphate transaminase [Evtepia sp.]|uniref:histidinol-phosphate transaminase n=1 Tax=Evtepia sp. TaxID=2773933 RepID=UPI002A758EFB|nr:histidinol-phosphate transaminase [Evtepia sp.]MDY3015298.1 histidinol-phosphate transaminase [Evtepia sp.]
MSGFMNSRYASLEAYTPGEQPRDKQYIKLNTNESPYPPSPQVLEALQRQDVADLRLYSDPEGLRLREKLGALYGLTAGNVFLSNGSDDILNFAFMAFGEDGAVFPGLTYSFYPVFANLHKVPFETVPLREDFTVPVEEMKGRGKLTVLANPNAPTGIALPLAEVEEIVASNRDHVVVIDEAYVDFGGQSAASLVEKYDNLLVVMTYSKSRSMAGARLGFALASRGIIQDLETLKYSTNPYNVNRLTLKLGEAAVDSDGYFRENAQKIMETRTYTAAQLRELGFTMPDSKANFLFVRREGLDGETLYRKLKERGILIRHFSDPRIAQYNRVTIGTREEMEAFLGEVRAILEEEGLP